MIWWGQYVGIPFVKLGRDHTGIDCWGLVALAYKEQLGIELPPYGDVSAFELIQIARAFEQGFKHQTDFTAVDKPQEFDIIAITHPNSPRIGHVGIVTGLDRMLHADPQTSVRSAYMSHPNWRHRIDSFWRHKSKAK